MVQPLGKNLPVSQQGKQNTCPDPAILLLGIYPREVKAYVSTKICTRMLIAALFIGKKWKPHKYPSTGEIVSPNNEILFSNKMKQTKTTWVNLKIILLSERSQTKKKKRKERV